MLYSIRKESKKMNACRIRKISTLLALLFLVNSLFSISGRNLGDRWPIIDVYRELELRGKIETQPNTWPDRSGVILETLPDNLEGASGFWAEKLRYQLMRTATKRDTISFFIEPGVNGILNNPGDPDDRLYPTLRLGGGMKKGIVEGYVSYIVNLRWAHQENYRGRQWAGFAGRPDQVYIGTSGDDWRVQFGKDYLLWGEGLILGKAHDPFERLDYEIWFGPFRLTGFSGFLDPMRYYEYLAEDIYISRNANRYLSGHRIEFISKHVTVALHEEVLYGGPGRSPEVIYLVPFYWFHAEQLNRGLDDNTLLGGDFQVLFPPVRFSGEVLVDDIQVEAKTQGDQEPPEIGIAGQLDWGAAIFSKWVTFRARYEGVTNWTYNQNEIWNRYLFMDRYLGSEYGNDYDRSSFGIDFFVMPELLLDIECFYFRKGTGRVTAIWTEPWMDVEGPYSEPFPTGVVEKTTGFQIDWSGFYRKYGFWNFGLEYGHQENKNHIEGKTGDYWQLDLQFDFTFYPSITL